MKNKSNIFKIYIINLKKDAQKKEHMRRLCTKYNLNVEFIEAVYGKQLSKNEIDKVYDSTKSLKLFKRELTLSEIGCAISHFKVYEKMIIEDIETALILEDDIEFDDTLVKFLSHIEKLPKQWEIVLLGHHSKHSRNMPTAGSFWKSIKLFDNYKIEYPVEKGYGTYGYLINKKGAEKLLDYLNIISYPIDNYTGNKHCVNVFLVNKPFVQICEKFENLTSMIERNNTSKNFKGILMSVLLKYKIVNLILFLFKLKKIKYEDE